MKLWNSVALASNLEKIQGSRNKILIAVAHWNIHEDLNIPLITDEIAKHAATYMKKLETNPNPLARNFLNDRGGISSEE